MRNFRIPAEWERHAFTMMTWPSVNTDWDYMLDEATECFLRLALAVAQYEPLLVVADNDANLAPLEEKPNISIVRMNINDTWARDHSFLTAIGTNGEAHLLDFQFNGWGLKFASCYDNQINSNLKETVLNGNYYHDLLTTVLEGGSIESDGKGTILTSSMCLLAKNRNGFASKAEAEEALKSALCADRFLWVDNGDLIGDDTDGHIDTIARLAPNDTIIYVLPPTDTTDPHYNDFAQMQQQLQVMLTEDGKPYNLVGLPFTTPCYDPESGDRLPATYANFYYVNGAILLPVYNVPTDKEAVRIMQETFPDLEIVAVDCRALIRQHGSLHCSTMQFPANTKITI